MNKNLSNSISFNRTIFTFEPAVVETIDKISVRYVDLDRYVAVVLSTNLGDVIFHLVSYHAGYAITIRVRGSSRFDSRAKISRAHTHVKGDA